MLYYTKRGLLLSGIRLFGGEDVPENPKEVDRMWTRVLSDLVLEDFIRTNDVSNNEFLAKFDLQEALEDRFKGSLEANYSDLCDWVKEVWLAEMLRCFIVDLNKRWS